MNIASIQRHVPKAIFKFAIPSIIAMILTSAISIIDGFFIGNYIGESALTAVNLGLPIMYLFLAISIMIGVGGVTQASRLLGAQKVEQSVNVFNQTALMGTSTLIAMALLFIVTLNPLSNLIGVGHDVKVYFVDYYFLMILVYPFGMLTIILGMFVRAEGKPLVSMILSIISVVMNAGLDYLFVRYFDYGVKGIAMASVISILVGAIYMLAYFKFKALVFEFRRFDFSKPVFINTLKYGSSQFIGQLSMCITTAALNFIILREAGVNGVAAFTVVGYSASLFTMVVIGLGQGASPLMSFANGANEHGLAKKVRDLTTSYVLVLGVAVMFLLVYGAENYSKMFVANESVGILVREGIPIFSAVFLFMGVNIITTFYFTSIGNAKASAIIAAARGLVIFLACIFIFPSLWGMSGVWLIAPITEVLALGLSLLFIFKSDKRLASSLSR